MIARLLGKENRWWLEAGRAKTKSNKREVNHAHRIFNTYIAEKSQANPAMSAHSQKRNTRQSWCTTGAENPTGRSRSSGILELNQATREDEVLEMYWQAAEFNAAISSVTLSIIKENLTVARLISSIFAAGWRACATSICR